MFPHEVERVLLSVVDSSDCEMLKRVVSLLVKEKFKPGDVTDEESIELHYVREIAEQAAKDAANGKTHGFMSFEEFAAKERGV